MNKERDEKKSVIDYRKKIKRKRIVGRCVLCLFLLCIIICVALFIPFFNIDKVVVTGNSIVKEEEILQATGIVGKNIFKVGTNSIKNTVQGIPYVNVATIKKSLPGTVKINVIERQKAAYIKFNNDYIVVDRWGRVLEIHNRYPVGLPSINNIKLTYYELGKKIGLNTDKNLADLVALMEKFVQVAMMDKVTYMDMETDNVCFMLENKMLVILGNTENLDYKLGLLNNTMRSLGDQASGKIDVSTGKKAVYKSY